MHISNDRYFRERQRHDLALRMIRHEARTCTIRACTGLTDDRIRKLYKTFAKHLLSGPVRRKRGKSPQRIAYFTRNTRVQFEASLLASMFSTFGLLQQTSSAAAAMSIEFGQSFCDAFETHRQLPHGRAISFEHAWFLLQLLNQGREVLTARCRFCHAQYLRDHLSIARRACPLCKLKGNVGPPSIGRPRLHLPLDIKARTAPNSALRPRPKVSDSPTEASRDATPVSRNPDQPPAAC